MNSNLPIKTDTLLDEALTHRSYLNENRTAQVHNERLEFLGDAVLELAVSEFLYQRYPDQPEGLLTAYRSSLVKTTMLAKVAQKLNLGEQLKMSKGEEQSGGRKNRSLLANTLEAVIGALYLDQGFPVVVSFLEAHLFPEIDNIVEHKLFKDHKSLLQEHVQAKGHDSPTYKVINEEGPDHNKEFTVSVSIDGQELAIGTGKSKQSAQQNCAARALEKLEIS
jgi:ribonuclease III